MKNLITIYLLLAFALPTFAQDAEFKVKVHPGEILMGNYFEVKFILKNGSGTDFSPPDFNGFTVIAGPSQSSSFSMVNGTVDQSTTYSFYLEPVKSGNFYIEPASIITDGAVLETLPVELIVLANPDGIKQDIPRENHGFDLNQNMDSFFDFDFNFGNPFELEQPKGEPKKKKKAKRKVYKI